MGRINKGEAMALNLRRTIVRNGVITGSLCLVLSMALSLFSGGMALSVTSLAWPVVLALGIGAFAAWQVTAKIKKGVINGLPQTFAYTHLTRGMPINGVTIKWDAIDDYAIQLESRGFMRLGDFTTYPLAKHFVGVASCFVDRDGFTLVELQQIQMTDKAAAARPNPGGLHVSVMSLLGGNITASTSDHTLKATNYLIRGDYSAIATFPGLGPLQLLEKHARLLAHLRERCGKEAMPGLNMKRYVLVLRERISQARKRLQATSGYRIAQQIDAFEAAPRTNWATSSAKLAALPERSFAELERSEFAEGLPAIMAFAEGGVAADAKAGTAMLEGMQVAPAAITPQVAMLKQLIDRSANWLYWVAGLSMVNTVIAAAGSKWAFAIGLGIPQLFIAVAGKVHATAGSGFVVAVLWAVSFAIPVFFAACGWFARRPSVVAFIAGAVLFLLDSMIFVLGGDWIGVAFHALVLYFLWKGIVAAREYKRAVRQ
jgi:hypothetical protein